MSDSLLNRSQLPQEGREQFLEDLTRRRAWTKFTFPEQVEPILNKLHALAARRKDVLAEVAAHGEEHRAGWRSRTGRRLPSGEFCDALAEDLELFHELQIQAREQEHHHRLRSLAAIWSISGTRHLRQDLALRPEPPLHHANIFETMTHNSHAQVSLPSITLSRNPIGLS